MARHCSSNDNWQKEQDVYLKFLRKKIFKTFFPFKEKRKK